MKRYCVIVLCSLYFQMAVGQTKSRIDIYPQVGKPMPNFVLREVQNYSKSKVTLDDFKGKWLVLDWWTQICAACVESFPRISALQKEFSDNVQFVSIAYTGSLLAGNQYITGNSTVRKIFNASNKVYNLSYPIAFDSVLYQKYSLGTTPYIVVIDPNGTIQAITTEISSQNLKDLMSGKKIQLRRAYRRGEEKAIMEIDQKIPFLTYGNGGSDTSFLFRSLLSNWNPSISYVLPVSISHPSVLSRGRFEAVQVPLSYLYSYAYLGKNGWDTRDSFYGNVYPFPILELKDSSGFTTDFLTGKGLYCYSLSVPPYKSNAEDLMQMMRKDLKSYFGYDARVEYRSMPYWKLTATTEARKELLTKSDTMVWNSFSSAGFEFKKVSIEAAIISALWGRFQNEPPFIDETGITGKIDIKINAMLSDFNDFKRALNENGLDLIKSEKKMKVLVIRDPKPEH